MKICPTFIAFNTSWKQETLKKNKILKSCKTFQKLVVNENLSYTYKILDINYKSLKFLFNFENFLNQKWKKNIISKKILEKNLIQSFKII